MSGMEGREGALDMLYPPLTELQWGWWDGRFPVGGWQGVRNQRSANKGMGAAVPLHRGVSPVMYSESCVQDRMAA